MTRQIILSDQTSLKEEKVNEFEQGLRPDGSIIGVYRNSNYAHYKSILNPKAKGKVDLILSRSFVNGLFVYPRSKTGYLFDSRDSKAGKLIGQYGQDVMGLNKKWFENRQKTNYLPSLMQQIKASAKIR